MVLGVAAAFQDFQLPGNRVAIAHPTLPAIQIARPGWPLDIGVKPNDRLSRESSSVKDSVNIIDSVRWETKILWKTRYKNVADRTAAREAGEHPLSVTPDSLKENLAITSTVDREEKTTETVDVPKTPSIQLSVDGHVVYSSNDNHSGVEGQ